MLYRLFGIDTVSMELRQPLELITDTKEAAATRARDLGVGAKWVEQIDDLRAPSYASHGLTYSALGNIALNAGPNVAGRPKVD